MRDHRDHARSLCHDRTANVLVTAGMMAGLIVVWAMIGAMITAM